MITREIQSSEGTLTPNVPLVGDVSVRLENMHFVELLRYTQAKSIQTANDATAGNSNVVLTPPPMWTASRADPGFYQCQAIRPMLFSSGWVACFVSFLVFSIDLQVVAAAFQAIHRGHA